MILLVIKKTYIFACLFRFENQEEILGELKIKDGLKGNINN